jgi:hypothetical protein
MYVFGKLDKKICDLPEEYTDEFVELKIRLTGKLYSLKK